MMTVQPGDCKLEAQNIHFQLTSKNKFSKNRNYLLKLPSKVFFQLGVEFTKKKYI